MKTAFPVRTERRDPWVPEGLLGRGAGRDSLEPLGLEVMMVLEEVMDNRARPAPPERQDSPVPPVLRAKSDLRALPAQTAPLDREENLDLRDTLVLRALRALLGTMGVPAAKVKWVPPAFLGLLACPEPGVPQARPAPMVFPASEVLPANPVRTVTKESPERAGSGGKLVSPGCRALRVKTASRVRLESLVPTDPREPQERGARPDSEELLEPTAFQEKRVPLGSAAAPAPQGPEEPPENLAETVGPDPQERGGCPGAQEDQAATGSRGRPDLQEREAPQVLQARLARGVSLASWASLALKATMGLLAKTESEVAPEVLAPRVRPARMVQVELRAPLDHRGQLVTKERQDPLALRDCRASKEPAGPPGRAGSLVRQAPRARPVRRERQEARETLEPLVSVGLLEG